MADPIWASMGAAVYEVTGDCGQITEWAMRIAGAAIARGVDQERDNIEHQVLNLMWRHFVRATILSKKLKLSADVTDADIYRCEWEWRPVAGAERDPEGRRGRWPATVLHPEGLFRDAPFRRGPPVGDGLYPIRENGMLVGVEKWDPAMTKTAASIAPEAEAEEAAERLVVDKSAGLNPIADGH